MKKNLSLLRPVAYFFLLLTFALIPLSLIEDASFCLMYNITGFMCCGCGVTRGFCAFMHFDFAAAAEYNPVFTYSIFPISVFLMLEDSVVLFCRRFFMKKRISLLEEAGVAVNHFLQKK